MDRLLTVKQAAEMLGVHKYTVYRYVKQGLIKPIKLPGRIRISLSEVERFISQFEGKDTYTFHYTIFGKEKT